jgi:ubiquinone/menaquinone biosynthesis C-methylase UbiE
MELIEHYRKVIFFALHLKDFASPEADNVRLMREHYAHITFDEICQFMSVKGKTVLDVGGATGTFSKIFNEKFGAFAINLDFNPQQIHRKSSGELAIIDIHEIWPDTVTGVAQALPFVDNALDVVFCRSILEHIPQEEEQSAIDELYRVTKKGGLCYIAIPPWYSPWAGHGLRPFHVFPFTMARKLKLIFFRNTHIVERSLAEMDLFPITFKKMSNMIVQSGFRIAAVRDTHFRLHFLAKMPIVREIAIPLVAFIAEK